MRNRVFAMVCTLALPLCAAAEPLKISMTYLLQDRPTPHRLSDLDPIPADLGQAGAKLALIETATTGAFLDHHYELNFHKVGQGEDLMAAAKTALARSPWVLLDMPAAQMLAIADLPDAQGATLFNVASAHVALREENCRANLLHTLPSNAMRADALMQFARAKRWTDLALLHGPHEDDLHFAKALRASAGKFGLSIQAEVAWDIDADMRRNAAQEVPVLTQGLGAYDLLLVADERDDFARFIPFNTWRARPVSGSAGLRPVAWSPVLEQWGAAQLQSRFLAQSARPMRGRDYAAWAAVRSLGEAVSRTNSADPDTLRRFILSDAFELAGFKGRPLSYRAWNGQLRQPIPLVSARAMITQAPLPGYLHQHSEMDTLGMDAPESKCEAFQ